jgi:putative Holliday junction resolvase
MVDERLSTFEAKQQQSRQVASYRDHPVDDLAAVIILQTWLSDPALAIEP